MKNIVISIFLESILKRISIKWQDNNFEQSNNYLTNLYSLNFNKNAQKITFNSPICLRLAQYYSLNPLDIAREFNIIYKQLALDNYINRFSSSGKTANFKLSDIGRKSDNWIDSNHILSVDNSSLHKIYFFLNISSNGWLELTLTDEYLKNYLCLLSNHDFKSVISEQNKISADFKYIYIYSRFHSILRSAYEQEIINFNNFESQYNWQIKEVDENIFNYLITQKKDYLDIVKTIIYCLEQNYHNQKIQSLNLIKIISKALYEWEKKCNIWGAIKDNNIPLAKAQLALTAIALKYYQSLCKSVFIEDFPTEL